MLGWLVPHSKATLPDLRFRPALFGSDGGGGVCQRKQNKEREAAGDQREAVGAE